METELKSKLNPCRRCGSPAIEREQMALPGTGSHNEYICCCSICIQRGEWKHTPFDARVSWNEKNRVRV